MSGKLKVTDKELVAQAKAGDEGSFEELINRHSGKMYQLAYGLISDPQDAEEVVQDAFFRAYRSLESFRGDASFSTWLYRIVTNLARNKYQWNRRRGADVNISMSPAPGSLEDDGRREGMQLPDESMGPRQLVQEAEFEDRIMEAVEQLPEKLREVIILRHVEDLPYDKIAEIADTQLGTVKSRLSRAREMLREILEA